jgi:Flp pilus assembly protein TadG
LFAVIRGHGRYPCLMRMTVRRARAGRSSRDDGAAAVEFALVLPLLILILFGIIDYGLYFGDALDTRSGVASATRQAIVDNFTTCSPPGSFGANSDSGYLACMVESRTAPLAGKTYVKVILPTDPANPASDTGWYPGAPVVVCEATVVTGVTGYVPLPTGGVIRTRLVSEIEQHANDASLADIGGADAPSGFDWDWCTPAATP